MSGRLFDCLAHFVIAVEIEDIRNQIKGILIILNLSVETSKVETIREVLLVDLAEVLIATARYELQSQSQQPSRQALVNTNVKQTIAPF